MLGTTLAAVVAALVMGAAAFALVRRAVPISPWILIAAWLLSMFASAALAAVFGVLNPLYAVSISAGALPVVVPLTAATRVGHWSAGTTLLAASAWSAVLVPFAVVGPPAVVAACPPEVCVVEDFGGALPLVVAAGAFLVVPSIVTVGRNRLRSGTGSRWADAACAAVLWVGFVVWLAAQEGAVDEYTLPIALAAAGAPATGALGWLLVDRARGVATTVRRSLRIGLLAGMAALLPCVVAVSIPWALAIGFLGGAVGALVHDSRALSSAAPGTRAAIAALAVGVIGMAAPGIVGDRLGFVYAARADVLLMQMLAVVAVATISVTVSIPVAMRIRRTA